MLKQVIDQWYKNKGNLEIYFRETPQKDYSSYTHIVKKIIELVLNDSSDESMKIDPEEISVIDDGYYQGTQIFFFHKITFQPEVDDYYWTNNFYESCSGCDTLLGISQYETGLPTNEQVSEYMNLSLNLIQKIKKLYDE